MNNEISFGNNLARTSDDLIDYLYEKRKEKIRIFRDSGGIDLHTHTNYSDGDLSPNELLKLAYENNISTISITDHNTVLGLKNIIRYDETEYVNLIPGIELSAKFDKGRMHILGYGIDIKNEKLNQKLNELKNDSFYKIIRLILQLEEDFGITFDFVDINKIINNVNIFERPHIAKLLVYYGYSSNIKEAFDNYLNYSYQKIKEKSSKLTYQECIDLIKQSGGIPVLAHPKSLELSEKEFLLLINEMINNGLMGIEVYHSSHTKEETEFYLSVAEKYNLLVSGGSDFHGQTVKPDINIGTGKGNLRIRKLSLLDELSRRT